MHLLLAITGHGFGHAAQTAPVIAALQRRIPSLQLTVRSDLAEAAIRDFLPMVKTIRRPVGDFGMAMANAFDVDAEASGRRYRDLHAVWPTIVAVEAAGILADQPDLVVSNTNYLALAAAHHAGIPSIFYSSLTWFDIYPVYCGARPEAEAVLADMAAAYRCADLHVMPTPFLPTGIGPVIEVGPVARSGVNRRDEMMAALAGAGKRTSRFLVLVSLGGITTPLATAAWPEQEGVTFVFVGSPGAARPDMVSLADLSVSFLDCLASVDALITKPGYGSFVEAACHGVPVLYADRGDWPDQPALSSWLHRHTPAACIERAALDSGAFAPELRALLTTPRRPPAAAPGAEQAADLIADRLRFLPRR
ncbi:MAG: hypothetical protein SF002_03005 [Alphaproteobacteria bacterium]|nr:hypothetical protein [Alphaproteobacteria bacterium]